MTDNSTTQPDQINLSDVMDKINQLQSTVDHIQEVLPTMIDEALIRRDLLSKHDIQTEIKNHLNPYSTTLQIDTKLESFATSINATMQSGIQGMQEVFEKALNTVTARQSEFERDTQRKQLEHMQKIDHNWSLIEQERKDNQVQRDQLSALMANQNLLMDGQKRWETAFLGDKDSIGVFGRLNTIDKQQKDHGVSMQMVNKSIMSINAYIELQQQREIELSHMEAQKINAKKKRNKRLKEIAVLVAKGLGASGIGLTAIGALVQLLLGS